MNKYYNKIGVKNEMKFLALPNKYCILFLLAVQKIAFVVYRPVGLQLRQSD